MKTSCLAEDTRREHRLRYRYATSGQWYKGSLHLHTNRSDGHLPLKKLEGKQTGSYFSGSQR